MIDDISLSEEQRLVRSSIRDLCADFDDAYWRAKDRDGEYPTEFVDALSDDGWFGALVPEEYGGAGLSTTDVVIMMEEIAASGGGFSATQSIHGGIYNSVPIVEYGGEELKCELLPKLSDGTVSIQSFGLTEPNAGSDATAIETRARREGDEYVVDGQKIWTSRVDQTDYLLLVARTTPLDEVDKKTRGISLFLVDVAEARVDGALETEQIPKSANNAVHAFELWFDDLRLPADALVGEEDRGFYHMLDGLNEERVVIAAACVGLGKLAVEKGAQYASEREVFGSPIGSNQGVQHPIAEAYIHVQGARQLTYAAAETVDDAAPKTAGAYANMSKYLAAEAAYEAADAAVQTHGGFGVAREYDVERLFREARLTRIVPVTQQLVLNYVGENVLDLPRSY